MRLEIVVNRRVVKPRSVEEPMKAKGLLVLVLYLSSLWMNDPDNNILIVVEWILVQFFSNFSAVTCYITSI
jgi:hypothetical protein